MNKPTKPLTKAAAGLGAAVPMESDPQWHPVAKRWFDSLASSGQSQFYADSDWGTAYLLAESMSRELNPQPVTTGRGDDAVTEMVSLPPKAASVAAWLKGMTSLLATEGDRRRAALELQRPTQPIEEDGDVTQLADVRRRLRGTG